MGNSQDTAKPQGLSLSGSQRRYVPLFFSSSCHGENVTVSSDKRCAFRHDSFCKGIVFSANTVPVGQKVYIKFIEVATNWSGALRFGFSSHDPSRLSGLTLPRYACPDLTNISGHWAKALSERHVSVGGVLWYYLSQQGEVHFGINSDYHGVVLSGINVGANARLWVLVDIYGNTTGIQLITRQEFDALFPTTPHGRLSVPNTPTAPIAPSRPTSRTPPPTTSTPPTSHRTPPPRPPRPLQQLPVVHHRNVKFSSLPFHTSGRGRNIELSSDGRIATRTTDEYCNAYVFTSQQIRCGERVVIKILNVEPMYRGGLAFGITNADPTSLGELPDDSDLLLDRPEYWAVHKNVVARPEMGDELSFFLSSEGAVQFSRNGNYVSVLMYVDKSLPLYFFFDVYACVTAIQCLGLVGSSMNQRPASPASPINSLRVRLTPSSTTSETPRPFSQTAGQIATNNTQPSLSHSSNSSPAIAPEAKHSASVTLGSVSNSQSTQSMPASTSAASDSDDYDASECKICFENRVDSVLYKCGHMCLCFTCASDMKRMNKNCPVCRAPILDIIRPFKS